VIFKTGFFEELGQALTNQVSQSFVMRSKFLDIYKVRLTT